MRIVLVKSKHASSEAFCRIVHRSCFFYRGVIGSVIIKDYGNNRELLYNRGLYTTSQIKEFYNTSLIKNADEAVVSISYRDIDSEKGYMAISQPATMYRNFGGVYPAHSGGLFLFSVDDFVEYPKDKQVSSINVYVRDFLLRHDVKRHVLNEEFDKIIAIDPILHKHSKMVFGTSKGLYIHNIKLFYSIDGIFVSDIDRALKITSFLRAKKSNIELPKLDSIVKEWRAENFHQRLVFQTLKNTLYFISIKELNNKSIPIEDKEKFIVITEKRYPYIILFSLKTGNVIGEVMYSILHHFHAFRIRSLYG